MATTKKQDLEKAASGNPYGVAVGQVWRNCDPRMTASAKVVSVDGAYAVINYSWRIGSNRMERRFRLDRFRKRANGFELLERP